MTNTAAARQIASGEYVATVYTEDGPESLDTYATEGEAIAAAERYIASDLEGDAEGGWDFSGIEIDPEEDFEA
jgi:hypothetical protein